VQTRGPRGGRTAWPALIVGIPIDNFDIVLYYWNGDSTIGSDAPGGGHSSLRRDAPRREIALSSPSRRQLRREQDINYILDVAERLFAEKGFVRVTMSELAQKAEFALGTIYSFFKGKRQLYDRLIDRKVGEYVATVRGAMRTQAEPLRRVEKFIEAKLMFAYQNRPFLRLHLAGSHGAPAAQRGEPGGGERETDDRAVFRDLVGALRKGISAGVFIEVDPTALAVALDGLTTAVALPWLHHASDESPTAEIEMVKQLLFRGMLTTAPTS